MEEGLLYQGPLGSFQEDSPPRAKRKHPREDRAGYYHQQTLDSRLPERSSLQPIEYSTDARSEHSPSDYNQRPFENFGSPAYHHYKGYGYHQSRYHHDASPSYYDPSMSMTSPRIDDRHSGVGGFGSPNIPVDFGSPPGITFSDSFGEGDTAISNNARIAFAPPISQRSNDSSDSTMTSSDDRSPAKRRGNPFRSSVAHSGTPPSKSPVYQSSPNLSFGTLDTPMDNHGDLSPMAPSFGGFADDGTSNDGNFHPHPLTMSRSHSGEDQSYPYNKSSRNTNLDKSPFSEFMDEFTPSPKNREVSNPSARLSDPSLHSSRELQGVRRSPVLSGNRSFSHDSPRSRRGKSTSKAASGKTPSDAGKPSRSLTIRPSPVAPSSEVKPRTLWQQPREGTIRLTLGQTGSSVPLSAQQRSLDDINSLMRAPESSQRASETGQTSGIIPPSSYDAYRHHSMPRPSYYHGIPTSQQRHSLTTPIRDNPYGYHSSLASIGSHHASMLYPHSTMSRSPPMRQAFQIGTPAGAGFGKENMQQSKTGSSKDSKKGKCNCKKSKCLKLYCECFAARLYCSGCNCKECHNMPEFEHERDKAVKAAITKNRAAFEPRINEEHNLGCKCKRSQCLKKYCEVRFSNCCWVQSLEWYLI
jgi:Tesmin/TSO1-like CXC domain, cysteine-rich domain